MVSGSAALPVSTLDRWQEISGHTLLERYGMTEIGMALSNPYRGERVPGALARRCRGSRFGWSDETRAGRRRERRARSKFVGRTSSTEYWGKPEATREAFRDGWFRTGDTAVVENGVYRILGPHQHRHPQDWRPQGFGAGD